MEYTKTATDARSRMDMARAASLAGEPTLEYLEVLWSEVRDWERAIRKEIVEAAKREGKQNAPWRISADT